MTTRLSSNDDSAQHTTHISNITPTLLQLVTSSKAIIPSINHSGVNHSKENHDASQLVIDVPFQPGQKSKIVVKRTTKDNATFEKAFRELSSSLANTSKDSVPLDVWNDEVKAQVESMSIALQAESEKYSQMAVQHKKHDYALRIVLLMFSSVIVFLNASDLAQLGLLKNINIALAVMVFFLNGIEGIMKFHTKRYQYAEAALALDGLGRTLKVQLMTPVDQRRDPTELVLFIESTRDKMLKKLLETS